MSLLFGNCVYSLFVQYLSCHDYSNSTDVWALGCCLYSMAFLQNCFEEGSNLAILSCNYKIPDDNPYGKDLAELIDRMLTVNCKERADMTEVILCLSAIYSGRPLPPRKRSSKQGKGAESKQVQSKERVGTYRTDGQGIHGQKSEERKRLEAKKLDPNSAAARRRKAAQSGGTESNPIPLSRTISKFRGSSSKSSTKFDQTFGDGGFNFQNGNKAFSGSEVAFSDADDPFHVGENFSGSKDDYESSEVSQDGIFDFGSDNGSGFDTFGSDDGSRSFGRIATDRFFVQAVSKANQSFGGMDKLNFDNFHLTEGNEKDNVYNLGNPTNDFKTKNKGIKKLFRKNDKCQEI